MCSTLSNGSRSVCRWICHRASMTRWSVLPLTWEPARPAVRRWSRISNVSNGGRRATSSPAGCM
nr:MAG TPA: hypothetical protein [Caudoviricetes sp.]